MSVGCAQTARIPSTVTAASPTPSGLPAQVAAIPPTATAISRQGLLVKDQGSSFGVHIPQNLIATDPARARYQIDLVPGFRAAQSCSYDGNHTLSLQEQYVAVTITDLETGQWAADQLFTDLEYADTTCPKTHAFSPGQDDTRIIGHADNSADEVSIFTNWLNDTLDKLAQAPAPGRLQAYKIGQLITVGDTLLVVLGWENGAPDASSQPPAGSKFVTVELLIVNHGQSLLAYSSSGMVIKDATGRKHEVDSWNSPGAGLGGKLAPGEKVRGKLVFQVPEDAQGLEYIFDDFVYGPDIVLVDLGAEPVQVEPPANLPGESSQPTYQLGDVITIGTATLCVNKVLHPAGSEYIKPDPGFKFLVVDLTIANKGAAPISVQAIGQMKLKNPAGQQYNFTLMALGASGGSPPDGAIAPGEKRSGQAGFQVPENASGLVFVLDASDWGAGKVFVALP